MNFFGHAAVAAWDQRTPAFVLGAMLPDLSGMIRSRFDRIDDSQTSAGVEHHHRIDSAFHDAPTFTAMVQEGRRELQARGLARGGALAASHVGLELLLDGTLVDDALACAAYLSALRSDDAAHSVAWRSIDGTARFGTLRRRLLAAGVPYHYRDPEQVAARIAMTLRHRPRLAIDDDGQTIVHTWLADTLPLVRRRGADLLDEVSRAVSQPGPT